MKASVTVDTRRAQGFIDRQMVKLRRDSMNWLQDRGHDIADLTQRKGRRKHGPLWARPAVRREQDLVRVGFFNVRPQTRKVLDKHLVSAKRFVMARASLFR